ncbi:class I SAM-dependent methyltransferase [Pontibacter toksunensis]|uniref:Class I SAM-dependent methyltransferase n=1 Tax=Pontibacter toksunensis TaxID=1332631 RepID=A0ABW6C2Y4_9BACT
MSLADIITQRIQQEGPVSFSDFMEMALYYPESGYYTSTEDKIGVKGDFYTSSILTPAFGAMVGRQMEQMWDLLGREAFTIVEYGAGTGSLCHSILAYLKGNEPLYDKLEYCIIEKSPALREKQEKALPEKVKWYNSIQDVPPITGCILSNEVVDNFAVHQVVMEEELMEVFVDYEQGFVEVLKPAPKALTHYLNELKVQLPKGFRTEINLEATKWISDIAKALKKGYVITIDYGGLSSELYRESRSAGTLVCYHEHQVFDNPYQNIGEQDITTHANFSALIHWGLKAGLTCCGITSQGQFLTALGFSEYLMNNTDPGQDIIQAARKIALINHTLLIDMGSKFKVLIQGKETPEQDLTGLKRS